MELDAAGKATLSRRLIVNRGTRRMGTAHRLALEVEALRVKGIATNAGMARALMNRGVLTPRGGAVWTHTTVARVIGRLGA